MISLYVNARSLTHSNVQHALRAPAAAAGHLPGLLIRFSSLLSHAGRRRTPAWAKELLKVSYGGINSSSGQATILVEARLVQPKLFEAVRNRVDDDVSFHPSSGAFAFRLHCQVGEPVVAQIRDRLMRIQRLIRFLHVVQRFKLPCESISLGRLIFRYSNEPSLRASIGFAGDAPMTLALDAGNPHLRLGDFLERLLNGEGEAGLEQVTILLGLTLPLLRAIDELETTSAGAGEDDKTTPTTLVILPRAADWLQLRYEHARAFFDIRLRQRRDEVKWFVSEDATALAAASARDRSLAASTNPVPPPTRPPQLTPALRALMKERGEGWTGLRTGIVAGVDGVAEVVRRIDAVVRDVLSTSSNTSNTPQPASNAGKQPAHADSIVILD